MLELQNRNASEWTNIENDCHLMAGPQTSAKTADRPWSVSGLCSRSVGGLSTVSPAACLSSSNALLARRQTDRELSSQSVGRLLTVSPNVHLSYSNAHLSYSNALLVSSWAVHRQSVSFAFGKLTSLSRSRHELQYRAGPFQRVGYNNYVQNFISNKKIHNGFIKC